MIDQQSVERAAERFRLPEGSFERLELRRDRKRRNQRIRAGVLGLAIAIAVGWWGIHEIRSTAPKPADDRSEELGIFAPIAGRILYSSDDASDELGDRGYDPGLWAVDPSWPSDTAEGPTVADDVASTLVRLGGDDMIPLGWSRDGTELLFKRTHEDLFPEEYLYILHADGSETQLNKAPLSFDEFSAAISPDGERVAYSATGGDDAGFYVIDADGGHPVSIEGGNAPTFSPDGTQIAYLADDGVWVTNVDGSDAHEILTYDQNGRFGPGVTGLQWSPAGDRLALGVGAAKGSDGLAIYTFAPDGSDFTKVITGGIAPYWSPDGSQIAYTILCSAHNDASCPEGSILRQEFDAQPNRFGGGSAGLAIADADGSNVRELGFAASGPWHPGASRETTATYNGPCLDSQDGPPTQVCLGPLEEGTYTSQRFEPALTFTVPAGWMNPWDSRGAFRLWSPGWSGGSDVAEEMGGYLFDAPGLGVRRDPRPDGGCVDATVGTSAIELATWVANHPAIAAGPLSPVEVGGLTGYQLDVSLADTWRESCPDGPGAVWLFEDVYLRDPNRYPEHATKRLILLDLPDGGSVLIVIDGTQVDAAMPVVDSFEFDLS